MAPWWRLAAVLVAAAAAGAAGEQGEPGGIVDSETCSAEEAASCPASTPDSGGADAPALSCGCGALRRSDFAPGGSQEAEPAAAPTHRPDSNKEGGETEKKAGIIWLDGGEFVMGIVPEDEKDESISPMDSEGPAHTEFVAPFGLGAYEVSNRRFARFVDQTGYVTESEKFGWSFAVEAFLSPEINANITQQVAAAPWWLPVEGADWRHPNGPDTAIDGIMDHPVTQVSMADAEAFCAWSRPGGRLPSEVEWEFAARGGRRQRRFPWGNSMRTGKHGDRHRMNIWQSELDERLLKDGKVTNLYQYGDRSPDLVREYYGSRNTEADGYRGTAPVKAYGPQNALGFYNMVGNVWEWTSSRWIGHPRAQPVEPNSMVKKGGSFLCNPATCNRFRCSARMAFTADSAGSNVGFRCAYPSEGRPSST